MKRRILASILSSRLPIQLHAQLRLHSKNWPNSEPIKSSLAPGWQIWQVRRFTGHQIDYVLITPSYASKLFHFYATSSYENGGKFSENAYMKLKVTRLSQISGRWDLLRRIRRYHHSSLYIRIIIQKAKSTHNYSGPVIFWPAGFLCNHHDLGVRS